MVYTERQDYDRLDEHINNNGAKWTKKFKPVNVLLFNPGTLEDENKITLDLMKKTWMVERKRW